MMKLSMIIAVGALLCGVAAADPGQEHSTRGQSLYREGKYREAHDEFAAGYEASKLPAFVFNMAECSRLAGDVDGARDEYAKYLALDPDGKLAELVNQRLAALPARAPAPRTVSTSPPSVPAPAIVASQREAAVPTRPIAPPPIDEPTPLWKRRSVWIAVGAALAAGTVVAFVVTRGSDCSGTCIDWRKP
jgi:tetratricopeptide (TPR) repeat protein